MKIIMTCMRYFPAYGGVESVVQNQAELLTKRGHNVTVYTSDLLQHRIPVKCNAPAEEIINGVHIFRLSSFNFFKSTYPILPALRKRLLEEKKADIIHSHSFWYYPAIISSLVAGKQGIPFVLQPHFDNKQGSMNRIYRRMVGDNLMSASAVLSVSYFEEKLMESCKLIPRNIIRLGNGLAVDEFSTPYPDIFLKFGIDSDRIKALFVGRIDRGKGIDVLLNAMPPIIKEFPEFLLFIVGEDFGERRNLENIIKDNHLSGNVIFAGRLTREDIISAYQHADLFILPSRYEAFGVVIIEGMRAGLPVIGSNSSAIPELIKDGERGWLFKNEDATDLTHQIMTVLKNPKEAAHRASIAKKFVLDNYSWSSIIDKLEKIYQSLSHNKIFQSIDWNEYAESRHHGRNRLVKEHHRDVLLDFVKFFSELSVSTPILDVGCSAGFFIVILRELGFENLQGIDISDTALTKAKKKNLDVSFIDLNNTDSFRNFNKKKVVLLMDVLEHIPDDRRFIKIIKDHLLEKNGYIYLTVPIYDSIIERLKRMIKNISRLDMAKELDPTHIHAHTERDIINILKENNFTIIEKKRLYCPLNKIGNHLFKNVLASLMPESFKGKFLRIWAESN